MAEQNIKGYRELTPNELTVINALKDGANLVGSIVRELEQADLTGFDQRWVAIGKTHLQQGFMALTRAVARPEHF